MWNSIIIDDKNWEYTFDKELTIEEINAIAKDKNWNDYFKLIEAQQEERNKVSDILTENN